MYARSDGRSFVPPGGICKGHNKPVDKTKHPVTDKVHLSINCDVCEAYIREHDPEMWSDALVHVPLTPREQAEVDGHKAQSEVAMVQFSQAFLAGYSDWQKQQTQNKK
jgi:hypothetical protein